ncbi:MAG: enoyl-CoA hydratase/isomerase family protein, partial [Thermoplasmata archaeon]
MTALSADGTHMDEEPGNFLITKEDGICTITLNRPKALNVFNEDTLNEFFNILDDVSRDGEVKVVVLLSACEKAFTAGADIKQMVLMGPAEGKSWSQLGHKIARKLETLPQPVIIGVNGYVLGGGVEFACACDIRIASEDSIFSQPEIDIGVIPGWGGTQRLSRIVGIAKAKEMIYTGQRVDAHEAKEIGLVNHVVPKEKLEEAVSARAQTLAAPGTLARGAAQNSRPRGDDSCRPAGRAA